MILSGREKDIIITGGVNVFAQDVEKVLPLAVTERVDTKYKAVNYEKLIPVLVEGVKELTERIKKLENKG